MKMYSILYGFLLISFTCGLEDNSITENPAAIFATTIPSTEVPQSTEMNSSTSITTTTTTTTTETPILSCSCGVFLSGQFKKGSKEQPKGNPALLHEQAETFPCSNVGNKMCTNKCLDVIVKHLPNSPSILCGSIDRDVLRERAYLFIKNCKDEWVNTNFSAGREYCCKNGSPYKCPVG